jgi:hypothetical protein
VQHVRGRPGIEEGLVAGVVPSDDVVLAAVLDSDFEDLALPGLLAGMDAVDDEFVSDLGFHRHLRSVPIVRPAAG